MKRILALNGSRFTSRWLTTASLGACFLAFAAITVSAQQSTVVAPSVMATHDAAFGAGLLRDAGNRFQEVYGSQHFPTQAMIITEIRYRPDFQFGVAFTTTVASIQFNLSTTRRAPDALSNTFADNSGTNDTVVFSGALPISSQFLGPASGPKEFDIAIPLTTPFFYNPAAGNLLVDVRNFSGSTASLLSGESTATDAASRVGGSLIQPTGGADSGVDAIQIVYVPTNAPPPPPPPPPSLALVRGPYLQSGTMSNIIVRWRTDQPGDSRAQFGLSLGSLNWEVADTNQTTEHSLLLTNLAPDTKYFYRIGATGTNIAGGPDYFFLTAPLAGKPTRIWAIGDCGTSAVGSYGQYDVRDAFYNYAGSRYTDVWLMLGDNAYYEGTDDQYQTAVFNTYQRLLRCTTLWSTIGNHDAVALAYFDIFTFPTHGEAGGVPSGTKNYYSFNYGNIHFVCLDSELSSPFVGGPMLNWMSEDLAANTNQWLIAFWHEPPYSKGSHDSDDFFGPNLKLTQMRENAVPILESYGVDLVLSGHSHVYERSYFLNGHYGRSGSLVPSMMVDAGSGREEDSGAYLKSGAGLSANQGAVYVVSGSSGWVTFSPVNHPAHYADPAWGGTHGLNQLGSMVIDVSSNRLDAKFLRETGAIDDHFTIIKGAGPGPFRIATLQFSGGNVSAQWKSIAGHQYQLEMAQSLGGSWTAVSPIVVATGATSNWSGPVAAAGQNSFFRVSDLGD